MGPEEQKPKWSHLHLSVFVLRSQFILITAVLQFSFQFSVKNVFLDFGQSFSLLCSNLNYFRTEPMCMGLDSHNWELRMQINYWRVRKMIASDHQIYLIPMYDQNLIFRIVPMQYLLARYLSLNISKLAVLHLRSLASLNNRCFLMVRNGWKVKGGWGGWYCWLSWSCWRCFVWCCLSQQCW